MAESWVRLLVVDRDFADPDGTWQRVSGIGADGALLVRPDQHVLWRATGVARDAVADLRTALWLWR